MSGSRMTVRFVAPLVLAAPGLAQAFHYDVDDWKVSLDSKFTVGASWRVRQQDPGLIGIANGGRAFSVNTDDGDLDFKKGNIVESVTKLTSDLSIGYGDFGVFVRGNAFFNPTLDQKSLFNPANYGPGKEAPLAELHAKRDAVRSHDAHYGQILDAYAYGHFSLFDRTLDLRVGRQTLNWGESTLVLNGINSILALDANRARVPGFELSEIVMPPLMVHATVDVVTNVTLESYYQILWEPTIIDASGTYFSTNDFAGIGGTRAYIDLGRAPENSPAGTICSDGTSCIPFGNGLTRAGDHRPSNGGQYGAALRFVIPQLNDTELALYAMRYHSRLPLYSGTSRATPASPASDGNYFTEYPEGIRQYGMSFNASIPFGIAMQGEYSFKRGQPLQLYSIDLLSTGIGLPTQEDPIAGDALGHKYVKGYRNHEVSQADLGFTKILGPQRWIGSEQILMVAEVADTFVHNLPPQGVLRYEGQGTYTPGDVPTAVALGVPVQVGGFPSKNSWGYKLLTRLTYNNVLLGGLDLEPTLLWQHDVMGITPTPIVNFVSGRRSLTSALVAHYHSDFTSGLSYVHYMGAGAQNLLRDRDYVQTYFQYAF